MVNKILFVTAVFFAFARADWMDDVANTVDKNTKEVSITKALSIIDTYIKDDKKAVEEIAKKREQNHDGAGMEKLHEGAYRVQQASADVQLHYHEKVRAFLKELQDNRRDRITFTNRLKSIKAYADKINALEKDRKKEESTLQYAKLSTLIASEYMKIKGVKAAIDGSLLI